MRSMWRSIGLGAAGLGWVWGVAAQALPPDIAQALAKAGVPASAVAMVVAPLPPPPGAVTRQPEPVNPSGEANPAPAAASLALPPPRLAWQPELPMNPASVMKLVTTYAGLDRLGPNHFWRTRVYAQGPVEQGVLRGNLLIQGSGDPKLVVERLQELIAAIRDKGVQHIAGDIVLDNSVFRLAPHDAAAFDDDPLRRLQRGAGRAAAQLQGAGAALRARAGAAPRARRQRAAHGRRGHPGRAAGHQRRLRRLAHAAGGRLRRPAAA
jgi:hypothetical protein